MVEASGLLLPELLADYWFLGLGDLISLTFCNGWTDVQTFDPWRVRLSGSQVFVSGDPFDGTAIPIAIEAKEIPRRAYRDEAEFQKELATAASTSVRGVVTSTPS
jgi:hypothetical protein